jgi:ferredoxin
MTNTLNKLLKSKYYPVVFQVITAALFSYITAALLFGPTETGDNFGSTITWILWWPLIPITFFLLGRIWCAICPFATIGDWIQTHLSFKKPVPKFLKKYGLWIINLAFIAITWYDLTYGLVSSVRASAIFLLIVVAASSIVSMFFARRTWCRYLCFLGGVFGNYSQTSLLELRSNPSKCKTCKTLDCYNGNEKAPGCILYEVPRVMDSNRTCNLCGDCLKSCKNDSPSVKLRDLPAQELWTKKKPRFDEAFLAGSLVGIILISGFGMTAAWLPFFQWFQDLIGISNEKIVTSMLFLIMLAVPIILISIASFISGKIVKENLVENFSSFAYSLIPLNLASHFAHNLFHFLGEGKSIAWTTAQIFSSTSSSAAESSAGHGAEAVSAALLDASTTQILQYILVSVGIGASLYVAYKIANKRKLGFVAALPHFVIVAIFGIATFVLFMLPMGMRH